MAAGPTCAFAQADASRVADLATQRCPIVHSDDGGTSLGVDLTLARLAATDIPLSVSMMVPTPLHQETVGSARRHADAAVRVHLTVNSERKGLRSRPLDLNTDDFPT